VLLHKLKAWYNQPPRSIKPSELKLNASDLLNPHVKILWSKNQKVLIVLALVVLVLILHG
jgi:hypothetical protein